MARLPRVDVIVPCYNYGRYVEACIASLLANDAVSVRVLIIDDGSSDDSEFVCTRLTKQHPQVTYRRHHTNVGHIRTYNEGLTWVEAEYHLLISADDLLTAGALDRAAACLEKHPDAAFVHGRQLHFIDEIPPTSHESGSDSETVTPGADFIAELCRQSHNPVATPTVLVRTAAQRRIGDYDVDLPHTADLHLWMRLALAGPVVFVDRLMAYKRQHARNMQLAYVAPAEGDVLERARAFDSFLEIAENRLTDAAKLRSGVRASLAMELLWRASAAFDAQDRITCDRLIDFAVGLDPEVRRTRPWRRMEIKRAIGPGAWRVVRSVVGSR